MKKSGQKECKLFGKIRMTTENVYTNCSRKQIFQKIASTVKRKRSFKEILKNTVVMPVKNNILIELKTKLY